MGRKSIYGSRAEQQQAYRQRLQARLQGQPVPAKIAKRPRAPSRPARLTALLEAVEELQAEYEQWLDNLPPGINESPLAERLQETIEQLTSVAEILAEVNPPKGFGRD